ncbi:hypothetical protein ARD30_09940 [Bosea thiooxidans]|uniref:Uncharacterized protein n=1 Tax=Bosea thiooxidans TaxID=53254 RepID=A0A0Q3T0E9_9HYPH|nr:hypothetical protein ARD30_09940 [Bosea thiooxidans]
MDGGRVPGGKEGSLIWIAHAAHARTLPHHGGLSFDHHTDLLNERSLGELETVSPAALLRPRHGKNVLLSRGALPHFQVADPKASELNRAGAKGAAEQAKRIIVDADLALSERHVEGSVQSIIFEVRISTLDGASEADGHRSGRVVPRQFRRCGKRELIDSRQAEPRPSSNDIIRVRRAAELLRLK